MITTRRSRLLGLFVLAWWLAGTFHASAQGRIDRCAEPATASPSDVRLQLSLAEQKAFQEGEIIPLRFALTSSAKDEYYVDASHYGRSSRLNTELFCLEPPRGRNPLGDYVDGQGAGIGGRPQAIGDEAIASERDLNAWLSIPPGRYRLRMRRIVERGGPADEGNGSVAVTVWSNAVELEVVPATPSWQEEQLAEALRALDSGRWARAERGASVLRFLGSEAATRELVRRYASEYGGPHSEDLRLGIIGSPLREVALSALRSALEDPQRPVNRDLIRLLAELEVDSDPAYRLPPRDSKQPAWAARRDARLAAQKDLEQRHLATAVAALEHKSLEARARSLDLILESLGSDPAGRARVRQLILATWDALPPWQQRNLLTYRWAEIGGPEALPLLRRLVEAPSGGPPSPTPFGREGPGRELPLFRLYALSPAEGRALILREIDEGKGDVGPLVLGLLPEKELPQIEAAIRARFETDHVRPFDGYLIERYASAGALPWMKRFAERGRGHWACDGAWLLRYFLRVDPEYGAAEVKAALSTRESSCYKFVFQNLGEIAGQPAVEPIAIAALDDPSPEVAGDAAEALAKYGSAQAEQPLWRRLERFHTEWKDREHLLRPSARAGGSDDAIYRQALLEHHLTRAIALGQSWFCGPEKLKALRELVSPAPRKQVDGWIIEAERDTMYLNVYWFESWSSESPLRFHLGSFEGSGLAALKQKLGQMPAGKRLAIHLSDRDREPHRAEAEEIETAARAAGLDVTYVTLR